jgi:biotin operon repressor
MSEPLDMAARDDLDRVRDALQNAVKELRDAGLDINLGYLKSI